MENKLKIFLVAKIVLIISILLMIVLVFKEIKAINSNENNDGIKTNLLSEEEKLKIKLNGKNLSILGDSISTFKGYSDNSISANSNLTTHETCYPNEESGIDVVEKTWWMKLSKKYNVNILVNNSLGGSRVENVGDRTNQLHDDTGKNKDTNPDIIAIYMGVNDLNIKTDVGEYNEELYEKLIIKNKDGSYSYKEATTFTEYYIIMIHKVLTNYDKADIFCFTLVPNHIHRDRDLYKLYNERIRSIADYFDIELVDIAKTENINFENCIEYSYESNALHPNEKGMNIIYNSFKKSLMKKYVK